MISPSAGPRIYRFGLFDADLENAVLLRQGVRVHLQEQPFRVLAALLEHGGQTVSREELCRQLWPSGVHVDFEGSLNAALNRLRTALGDDPDHPTYIETVPKRGYRFIAPVAAPAAPTGTSDRPQRDEPAHEVAPAPAAPPVPRWLAWTAGALVLALVATALAVRRKPATAAAPRVAAPPVAADLLAGAPAGPEAARFYALGLEKLQADDPLPARDLLLQAEALVPGSAMVHLLLARAWGGLGYDAQAKAETQRAFSLASGLPAPERLLIQGAYYGSVHDLDRAATAYRALYALNPGSVDDGEQLIVALNAGGRRDEALAVVHQLRQLPPPASADPRLDFWEARLISFRNGAAAAPYLERALAAAAASGRPLLYARFRLDQC
ncbi:MAG: winged helix-turn-helix domain-containing protein, partial [Terriglobales bacterium]